MTPDFRWLELLKASGWQMLAIAAASGLFLLMVHWGWLPPLAPWMVQLAVFGLLLAALLAIASLAGYMHTKHEEKRRRDAQRFENVYAQLYSLFVARHVTVVIPRGASSRERLRNAYYYIRPIGDHPRPIRAVGLAARALFDRKIEPSAEIEYGPGFPLDKIRSVTCRNAKFCDQKLLILVARADRARYELGGGDMMTREDLELHDYIEKQHTYLSKRHA